MSGEIERTTSYRVLPHDINIPVKDSSSGRPTVCPLEDSDRQIRVTDVRVENGMLASRAQKPYFKEKDLVIFFTRKNDAGVTRTYTYHPGYLGMARPAGGLATATAGVLLKIKQHNDDKKNPQNNSISHVAGDSLIFAGSSSVLLRMDEIKATYQDARQFPQSGYYDEKNELFLHGAYYIEQG
ncbi:hypothetical protein [Nocardiopsis deserti]|uniref:hypothetical protein n=1 Tax=Nocardiopsis deserti TaxID=2605988 RepID=UPI00123B2620|nr:hypothetical protein [Nocardiopsis deserti]